MESVVDGFGGGDAGGEEDARCFAGDIEDKYTSFVRICGTGNLLWLVDGSRVFWIFAAGSEGVEGFFPLLQVFEKEILLLHDVRGDAGGYAGFVAGICGEEALDVETQKIPGLACFGEGCEE